jgi:hypothetical protein
MFDRLNAMAFADGGPVSKFASGGSVSDKIAELRALERVRRYEKN